MMGRQSMKGWDAAAGVCVILSSFMGAFITAGAAYFVGAEVANGLTSGRSASADSAGSAAPLAVLALAVLVGILTLAVKAAIGIGVIRQSRPALIGLAAVSAMEAVMAAAVMPVYLAICAPFGAYAALRLFGAARSKSRASGST
jgi:hypothetical protein